MNQLKTNGRSVFITIDIARFFAAFSVYWYHQHLGYLLGSILHLTWFGVTDSFGSVYAVPLFFLISGFCIHLSNIRYINENRKLPIKSYYQKRLWRIYPPYIIAVLFSITVNVITKYKAPPQLSDVGSHLFLLHSFSVADFNSINLVLWTIAVEVCFYLMYPIFYYFRQKYSLLIGLGSAFIISAISITSIYIFDVRVTLPVRYLFLNLWFAWCVGAWLCDQYYFQKEYYKTSHWRILSSIIFITFVLTESFHWQKENLIKDSIHVIIWAPVFIWFIGKEALFQRNRRYLRIPLAIGTSSYSLYLLHEPLIEVKNFIINNYLPENIHLLGMIAGLFIIPIIAYVNYKLFELPFAAYKKKSV